MMYLFLFLFICRRIKSNSLSKISNLRINYWINFYSCNENDVYLRYALNGCIIFSPRKKTELFLMLLIKKFAHTNAFCPPPLYFSELHVYVCPPVDITWRFFLGKKATANIMWRGTKRDWPTSYVIRNMQVRDKFMIQNTLH